MRIIQIDPQGNVDAQITKIIEELGEVIQAIKLDKHTRYILEEINDVLMAVFTLKFMVEPDIKEFNRSWEVTHMEKLLVRDAQGKIKIKTIHEV